MGQAREVMDRVTAAVLSGDAAGLAECYAENAVAITPDQGEIVGRDAICKYHLALAEAFPDTSYEYAQKYEAGNVAIDEGYLTGTNSGPLPPEFGDRLSPTGKRIRIRSCDIAQVEGDQITRHDFYFDQMEFLGQLGLLPEGLPS